MDFNKVRSFCRPFRIVMGSALIAYGIYSGNAWFYLGAVPLIAGLVNFCPLCIISKKCDDCETCDIEKAEITEK